MELNVFIPFTYILVSHGMNYAFISIIVLLCVKYEFQQDI